MINPHTVEFISNLIEYECDAMISQCHVSTLDHFVLRQFSLDVQKAFVRQWVQILLQYGYSYFVAVSERCVGERAVRVSLNLDDAVAPNVGRNGNALPPFAVGSIRFFIAFFLVVFFFDFIPIPILAFIPAQTAAAAALSLRAESLAVTRPSALSASTLSRVYR